MRLTTNISRTGGKYNLLNILQKNTPNHKFFLSTFLGSGIYEINKPKAPNYECFNDIDSELINYFVVIQTAYEEFRNFRKGIFELVSQKVFEMIISGRLKPENDIERAVFFFYINKLAFGGSKGKGYRGISPKVFTSNYMGMNVMTNRPYTTNDHGLLTPLNKRVIDRLLYVQMTCYPYDKILKMFEKSMLNHQRSKLAFVYMDPPYIGSEGSYEAEFNNEDHNYLIDFYKESEMKLMLSVGGDCGIYLDELSDFYILPVKTRYATNPHSKKEDIQEYIIMNYDIKKEDKMVGSHIQKSMLSF